MRHEFDIIVQLEIPLRLVVSVCVEKCELSRSFSRSKGWLLSLIEFLLFSEAILQQRNHSVLKQRITKRLHRRGKC
jgi:hypothetical protein